MKKILLACLTFAACTGWAQQAENIIIITTDGMRWQEVFGGMDSSIANKKRFNEGDSANIYKKYWDADARVRRQKLMPFFWSHIQQQGQLYGNRQIGSLVNVANPHWFSYPGYSEIVTGHVDTAVNSNNYPPNPNVNLLEFLNKQPGFQGKVAAYGAWEAFNRILNEKRSGFPVIAAYDTSGAPNPTASQKLINAMLTNAYRPWHNGECLDVFTHYAAMEHLKTKKPRVLYIAYGETDEWAHAGKYRSYLDAAHQVDKWIGEIWQYVQSDPQYKNKTAIFITTDHGRGDGVKSAWTSHDNSVPFSYEIWFAAFGKGVPAKGEMSNHETYFQKQFAQTMARLLGKVFTAPHQVSPAIDAVTQPAK